ncbi:hypothetical protein WA158_007446 [Blastocystis sp. Blastoise]
MCCSNLINKNSYNVSIINNSSIYPQIRRNEQKEDEFLIYSSENSQPLYCSHKTLHEFLHFISSLSMKTIDLLIPISLSSLDIHTESYYFSNHTIEWESSLSSPSLPLSSLYTSIIPSLYDIPTRTNTKLYNIILIESLTPKIPAYIYDSTMHSSTVSFENTILHIKQPNEIPNDYIQKTIHFLISSSFPWLSNLSSEEASIYMTLTIPFIYYQQQITLLKTQYHQLYMLSNFYLSHLYTLLSFSYKYYSFSTSSSSSSSSILTSLPTLEYYNNNLYSVLHNSQRQYIPPFENIQLLYSTYTNGIILSIDGVKEEK